MSVNREVLVYTYGAFDLLHVGHIVLLEKAKKLGDKLIVGILSDKAIRKRKGNQRPLQTQKDRARIVGALGCVDYVVNQETYDPTNVLKILRPDILTKGDDWDACVKIADKLGFLRFEMLHYSPEYSTTKIVEKMNASSFK